MIKRAKTLLGKEQKYFNVHKSEFLKKYKNRFVLIKDNELIGVYDSLERAYEEGLNRFGNKPMFIKQVAKEEPISFVMSLA